MGKSKRGRGARAKDGGQPQGGFIRALLQQELKSAIFGFGQQSGQGGAGHPRGAQWRCAGCSKLNDKARKTCRDCGNPQTEEGNKPPGAKVQRPPQVSPALPKPWVKLEQAMSSARQAGAPEEAFAPLRQEVSNLKAAAAEAREEKRTPGDKLNMALARERNAKADQNKALALREKLEGELHAAQLKGKAATEAVAKAAKEIK